MAGGATQRLLLAPSATPHRLFVSNLPSENAAHRTSTRMSDEEMGAFHFGVYYRLLLSEPTPALPQLWHAPRGARAQASPAVDLPARPVHPAVARQPERSRS